MPIFPLDSPSLEFPWYKSLEKSPEHSMLNYKFRCIAEPLDKPYPEMLNEFFTIRNVELVKLRCESQYFAITKIDCDAIHPPNALIPCRFNQLLDDFSFETKAAYAYMENSQFRYFHTLPEIEKAIGKIHGAKISEQLETLSMPDILVTLDDVKMAFSTYSALAIGPNEDTCEESVTKVQDAVNAEHAVNLSYQIQRQNYSCTIIIMEGTQSTGQNSIKHYIKPHGAFPIQIIELPSATAGTALTAPATAIMSRPDIIPYLLMFAFFKVAKNFIPSSTYMENLKRFHKEKERSVERVLRDSGQSTIGKADEISMLLGNLLDIRDLLRRKLDVLKIGEKYLDVGGTTIDKTESDHLNDIENEIKISEGEMQTLDGRITKLITNINDVIPTLSLGEMARLQSDASQRKKAAKKLNDRVLMLSLLFSTLVVASITETLAEIYFGPTAQAMLLWIILLTIVVSAITGLIVWLIIRDSKSSSGAS
jgi:hypothetical protein